MGVSPRSPVAHQFYPILQGDKVTLKVNKLTSVKNLPYEYYSLPYCQPEKVKSKTENLGELLRGDRIENSPYQASIINFYATRVSKRAQAQLVLF